MPSQHFTLNPLARPARPLAVPVGALDRLGPVRGFDPDSDRVLASLLRASFVPRDDQSIDYLWLVAYIVVRYGDRVATATRFATHQGRQVTRRSLGWGGPVDEYDMLRGEFGGRDVLGFNGAALCALSASLGLVGVPCPFRRVGIVMASATRLAIVYEAWLRDEHAATGPTLAQAESWDFAWTPVTRTGLAESVGPVYDPASIHVANAMLAGWGATGLTLGQRRPVPIVKLDPPRAPRWARALRVG